MRIQSKLLILLLVLTAVICTSLVAMRNQERKVIHVFFQKEIQGKKGAFERVFAQMSNTMQMLVDDYSQWEGMHLFLENIELEESNNKEFRYLIDTYKMSGVWLYDVKGNLQYSITDEQAIGNVVPEIPQDAFGSIFQNKNASHFFLKTNSSVIEMYGAPVHPSSKAESLAGYFFLGRKIDKNYLAELEKLIEGRILLMTLNTYLTEEYDEKAGTFSFVHPLPKWNGITQAYMLVHVQNDMIKNLNDEFIFGFFVIVTIISFAVLAVCFCIFYWINVPLLDISKSLKAEDASYIEPLQGQGCEFAEIAQMISEFFEQKQEILQQMSSRMIMEKELLLSEQRFRIAAECASDLVYDREPEGGVMEWYGLVDIRLGYEVREFPRTTQAWEESIHPDDREEVMQLMINSFESSEQFYAEYRIRRKDGTYLYWKDRGRMLFDAQGIPQKMIGVITDITERRMMEDELKSLSLTDPLTGLYNRRGFMTLAQQQIRIANRNHEPMILFYTDVDGLKDVNDNHGHSAGDELILLASRVMRECFRQSDIIARMGGDEFAVLVVAPQDENEDRLGQRLQDIMDEFNTNATEQFKISMSIGSVRYDPANPCSVEDLIAQADQHMYVNKRARKAAQAKDKKS